MTNNSVVEYSRRVQELEERYRAEGYDVLTQPLKDELPPFLRYFHPDMIAVGPNQSIVVEVKAAGKIRRMDYWRELADAVNSHPGWYLELLSSVPEEEQKESFSPAEIEEQISRSMALEQAGEFTASLLLAWSATEAALRLTAERHNVEVFQPQPMSLISRLFSEGLMDRQDYDFLKDIMQQRNSVAHGFRQKVRAEDIERLRAVVQNLLTE